MYVIRLVFRLELSFQDLGIASGLVFLMCILLRNSSVALRSITHSRPDWEWEFPCSILIVVAQAGIPGQYISPPDSISVREHLVCSLSEIPSDVQPIIKSVSVTDSLPSPCDLAAIRHPLGYKFTVKRLYKSSGTGFVMASGLYFKEQSAIS